MELALSHSQPRRDGAAVAVGTDEQKRPPSVAWQHSPGDAQDGLHSHQFVSIPNSRLSRENCSFQRSEPFAPSVLNRAKREVVSVLQDLQSTLASGQRQSLEALKTLDDFLGSA